MKKILSTILAIAMALSMGTMALAADDGTVPTLPSDGSAGATEGTSTGAATVLGDSNGTTTSVTGDDDNLAGAADLNGADINVWAKVLDSSTKIYKVDLGWGAMKFQYTSTAGQWDPETHTYASSGGGVAAWTVDGYLDGENNKIDVTNHSNNAVDASFAYAMEPQAFNDSEGADAVVGNFFKENDKAAAAALVLTEVANVTDKLTDSKISLHTADAYGSVQTPTDTSTNVAAGERTDSVYFAFSGTPDEGKGATLNDFTKVGVITVTVAPNTEMADEYAVYTE